MSEWKNIGITVYMRDEIQELIDNPKVKGKYAFSSVNEFVRRACSKLIEEINTSLK